MITIVFLAFLGMSMSMALVDWRRGWVLAVACGMLQDPARKLTPGTPVAMTLSVVLVYAVVLFSAQHSLQAHAREFSRRFSSLKESGAFVFIFLFLAAVNGLFTFGLENWKAPALALFLYCAPIPAVLLGFTYVQKEEQLYNFFRFYVIVTSITMVGTVLEYLNVQWRALGTVALDFANLRYLPGMEIRMLSGFYRAPDVMGWHAATLTMLAMALSMRAGSLRKSWPWILAMSWGFLNCLISGRRKAVYMVFVFAAAFLFRYIRRLSVAQVTTFVAAGLALFVVVEKIGEDREASVYTRGTATSTSEVMARLEGGLMDTISQYGIMGGGLGTATQGVYHVISARGIEKQGWQEGGLGKLTMELGIPGLLAAVFFGVTMIGLMLKISGHPDVAGSSQMIRAILFGIVVANIVQFFVSAQAYSDAVLTLLTAFFTGALFATALLDERTAAVTAPQPSLPPGLPIRARA